MNSHFFQSTKVFRLLLIIFLANLSSGCLYESEKKHELAIVKVSPEPDSEQVYIGEDIVIEFNEPISHISATINGIDSQFVLPNKDYKKLRFRSIVPLQPNQHYTVSLSNIVSDDTNLLHDDFSWSFKTGEPNLLKGVKQITSVEYDSEVCVIDSQSRILCWGAGQPAPRMEPMNTRIEWTYIANGTDNKCGIDVDSQLWCWGSAFHGELGFADSSKEEFPRKIELEKKWSTVVLNSFSIGSSCAITVDGELYCWGTLPADENDGNHKQFLEPTLIPVPLPEREWQSVAMGAGYSFPSNSILCGILNDGTLWCWGDNDRGGLGDGTKQYQPKPVQIGVDSDWAKVDVSDVSGEICGIKNDGSLWCWGNRFAFSSKDSEDGIKPERFENDVGWKHTTFNGNKLCALKENGSLWCKEFSKMTLIHDNPGWIDFVVTNYTRTFCGMSEKKEISCLGYNRQGVLGIGVIPTTYSPSQVIANNNNTWKNFSLSRNGACGITSPEGALYCWGEYLSLETEKDSRAKAKLLEPEISLHDVVINSSDFAVSGNDYFGGGRCAVTNDARNKVICTDNNGLLTADKLTLENDEITKLFTGKEYCVLSDKGKIWCWEYSMSLNSKHHEPVEIVAPESPTGESMYWLDIAMGNNYRTCGIRSDNTLWCWKNNIPEDATLAKTYDIGIAHENISWKQVAIGNGHNCGITVEQELFCWGSNSHFGLASSDAAYTKEPIQIHFKGVTQWKSVSVGLFSVCAIDLTNRLFCWGDSFASIFGEPARSFIPSIVEVKTEGNESGWQSIQTIAFSTCALKIDGSLWCWGENEYGQVGNGHSFSKNPVSVISP